MWRTHVFKDACFQVDFSSIFSFHWVIYIYILYSSLFHSLHHIIPSLRVQICACTHANLRECTSSSSCCTQAHVLIWHRPGCSRRIKEHLSTGGGFHHALWRQIPSLHDASELLDLQIISNQIELFDALATHVRSGSRSDPHLIFTGEDRVPTP